MSAWPKHYFARPAEDYWHLWSAVARMSAEGLPQFRTLSDLWPTAFGYSFFLTPDPNKAKLISDIAANSSSAARAAITALIMAVQ